MSRPQINEDQEQLITSDQPLVDGQAPLYPPSNPMPPHAFGQPMPNQSFDKPMPPQQQYGQQPAQLDYSPQGQLTTQQQNIAQGLQYSPQGQPPNQQQNITQGFQYPPQGQPVSPQQQYPQAMPVPVGQPISPVAQPQQQSQQQAILINQISVQQQFKSNPTIITCPFCKNTVSTIVENNFNAGSCILCLFTGILCWVIILSCMGKDLTCCDATHKCPNCGSILGKYTAI